MRIKNNTLDIIALSSSLICAIHCIAVPIALSFSTWSSLHFLENPYIEWSFIVLGILFVFISLWPSYKKKHRQIKPLFSASLGFVFIALGRFAPTELWETSNTAIGASLVSLAHYINWRILRNPDHRK